MISDNSPEYGSFFLTGSQQFHLMKDASESLAGRVSILELQGLSARKIYGLNFNKHFLPNDNYINSRKKELKDLKIYGKQFTKVHIRQCISLKLIGQSFILRM